MTKDSPRGGYQLMGVVSFLILFIAIKDSWIRLHAGRVMTTDSYMLWATGLFLLVIAVVGLWPKKV